MWTRGTGPRLPGNCLIEKRVLEQPLADVELYGLRLEDFLSQVKKVDILGKRWTVIGLLLDICGQICLYIHGEKIYMQ